MLPLQRACPPPASGIGVAKCRYCVARYPIRAPRFVPLRLGWRPRRWRQALYGTCCAALASRWRSDPKWSMANMALRRGALQMCAFVVCHLAVQRNQLKSKTKLASIALMYIFIDKRHLDDHIVWAQRRVNHWIRIQRTDLATLVCTCTSEGTLRWTRLFRVLRAVVINQQFV